MKPLFFLGKSLDAIREFPKEIKQEVGYALETAQIGRKAINVVPLVGFGGGSVLEVISNGEGGAYRAVYTVRFANALYVLHAFQKKAKRGIATPKTEMALIRRRLKAAQEHHEREFEKPVREKRHVRTKG